MDLGCPGVTSRCYQTDKPPATQPPLHQGVLDGGHTTQTHETKRPFTQIRERKQSHRWRERKEVRLNLLEDKHPHPKHLERGTDSQGKRQRSENGRWSSREKPEWEEKTRRGKQGESRGEEIKKRKREIDTQLGPSCACGTLNKQRG